MTARSCGTTNFNPRAPCGARLRFGYGGLSHGRISIHAPRAGRDAMQPPHRSCGRYFNPRAPCGARLIDLTIKATPSQFQSTRPVRGATRTAGQGDRRLHHFNPRAPCGARLTRRLKGSIPPIFQSTRPVRGATTCGRARGGCNRYFNPRAPCGARLDLAVRGRPLHPFQSTRPVRGATPTLRGGWSRMDISIHAPRAGRDLRSATCQAESLYFNPRAPCGARPIRRLKGSTPPIFQSTRPVRGATLKAGKITPAQKISIHAPRAGRDEHDERRRAGRDYFNPRAPCGARPYTLKTTAPSMTFQSTRPVRGATLLYQRERRRGRIFQSTRPVRGATGRGADRDDHLRISIHAPRAGRDSKSIQNYFTHFCDKRQFLDNFTQNAAF